MMFLSVGDRYHCLRFISSSGICQWNWRAIDFSAWMSYSIGVFGGGPASRWWTAEAVAAAWTWADRGPGSLGGAAGAGAAGGGDVVDVVDFRVAQVIADDPSIWDRRAFLMPYRVVSPLSIPNNKIAGRALARVGPIARCPGAVRRRIGHSRPGCPTPASPPLRYVRPL